MKVTQNELKSGVITLLLTIALGVLLVCCTLHYEYPPKGMEELAQALPEDSIFMEEAADEYVKMGDIPEPQQDNQELKQAETETDEQTKPEPDVDATDLKDAGKVEPKQPEPIKQKQESPQKIKESKKPEPQKPEKTGAARANNKPEAKKPETKRSNASASTVSSDMKNVFGSTSGKGSKSEGSPNGNSATGALQGHASLGDGLVGYTVERWGRPHSTSAGTITIRVTVNPRGKVIKASYAGGTGEARNNTKARQSCIEAAKQSQFSVPLNRTTDGVGTITWRFI